MSLVYNGTTITQPIYNGTSLGKVNVALTGENLKEAKRSAISTYTKAQVDGWIGITDDTWSSITNASSFTAGEYIYLTFTVSDTGKLARFLMRFKSYSGTTITVDNIGWGYVGSVLGTITVWEYQASWHTVWTGSKATNKLIKGESTGRIAISGLQYNIPTRISGNYKLYTGDTQTGSGTYNEESINQTSASYTTVINIRIPTATNKWVYFDFNVNSAGYIGYKSNAGNLVGDGTDGLTGAITKVEQYY